MRFALLNPNWTFEGSIYFGCREPHLPLELGYARTMLEQAGHQALLVDAQLLEARPRPGPGSAARVAARLHGGHDRAVLPVLALRAA